MWGSMMKNCSFRRILAFLLIIGMVLNIIPSDVYASGGIFDAKVATSTDADEYIDDIANTSLETYDNTKELQDKEPIDYYEEEDDIDGEIVEASEEAVTYQIEERKFITEIGGSKKTFQDEEGNYDLVDNTLEEVNEGSEPLFYENTAGDYQINLPSCITNNNGIRIEKDGRVVELTPIGGDFSHSVASDNAIIYNNVYDGIDYQYTILGDMVKEDIVLNRPVDLSNFQFVVSADDSLVTCSENIISIADKETNEVYFNIVAPEMIDAAGEISNGVFLSLGNDDGRNIATVSVDEQWLDAPERTYPVRIDPTINVDAYNIGLYGVEQGAPTTIVGDNNYPYSGYDDGLASSNLRLYGRAHLMTRTYVDIDYDFTQIDPEAKIENATFSLYHYTDYSGGNTNFGLYSVDDSWDGDHLTWNNQLSYGHTFIEYCQANTSAGYLDWDVREIVNNWINGLATNNGFVIKAEDERNMQCEVFYNKNGVYKPKLTIEWTIPDPVDQEYSLDSLTVVPRPITEKNLHGKLKFDAVFADGVVTPKAEVTYNTSPKLNNIADATTIGSSSYKYPDSTDYNTKYPNGTKYKDKLSNWQTGAYSGFDFDKIYKFVATAEKNGAKSPQKSSDTFLIYKVKQTDTFPYIANYYGVPLSTIMADNKVQDTLVIENNTIFIRKPKTDKSYTPDNPDEDAMRAIDSSLMGRGLHCEYGFEPINLNTGNFFYNTKDISLDDICGDFSIERSYNSEASSTSSIFGRKWSFKYNEYLTSKEDGSILYNTGDGKVLTFKTNGAGGYSSPSGYYLTLTKTPVVKGSGDDRYTTYSYKIEDKNKTVKSFNTWGLITEINENGIKTTIEYDNTYKIKSIKSQSGLTYSFSYDNSGRVIQIMLPNSAALKYEYSADGDLIKFTDADGKVTKYSYDKNHHMVNWYDKNGNRVILNQYDSMGRVTAQTDANGGVSTFEYKSNKTITTDAEGYKTTYEYDNNHRTTRITYADGTVKEYSYDASNNLSRDDRFTYNYDSKGNLLSQKRMDGCSKSYKYDSLNNIVSITDYNGVETKYTYSAGKDLLSIDYPDGTKENFTYNNNHQIVSHVNGNGNIEEFSYNGANLVKYIDFSGNQTAYSYNNMNQLTSVTYANGSTERYMYSKAGKVIGKTLLNGGYVEYRYDNNGNMTGITDAMGYSSDIIYDHVGNIIKVSDAESNETLYKRDKKGNVTRITSPSGFVSEYKYDSNNRIIEVIEDSGNNSYSTKFSYDSHGNILSIIDANDGVTKYTYDTSLDKILSEENSLGYTTNYSLDSVGNVTRIDYPDNTHSNYSYDTRGRLISSSSRSGLITQYSYDGIGNVTEINEGARKNKYFYDANSNLTSDVDSLGNTTRYEYDKVNNCTSITYPNNAKYEYKYDVSGNAIKIIDPLANEVSFDYDLNNNNTAVTDENGNKSYYSYSPNGHLISYKNTQGYVTNMDYDPEGMLDSVTNALGEVTSYKYDYSGSPVEILDPNGDKLQVSYDYKGNPLETRLSNGDSSKFEYDALGRLISKSDAAGLKINYEYDEVGNILTQSDNAGNIYNHEYDEFGRLIKTSDVLERSTLYSYNEYSEIINTIGVDGLSTSYDYDELGRCVQKNVKDGLKEQYIYDSVGNILENRITGNEILSRTDKYEYDITNNLTTYINAAGDESKYKYDKTGNLTEYIDGNGVSHKYTYDSENNLVEYIDGNKGIHKYSYDSLGRLEKETDPKGNSTSYTYNSLGQIETIKDANGSISRFSYDIYGNVITCKESNGATTTYKYDKHSNLIEEKDSLGYSQKFETNLNGMITKYIQKDGSEYTYSYDAVNRIKDVTTPKGYKQSFSYDASGNISTVADNLGREVTYEYDELNNLTKEIDSEGKETEYSYDILGNLLSVKDCNDAVYSYTVDALNRVTETVDPYGCVSSYQYDGVGNTISVSRPEDRNSIYKYDSEDNLTEVISPNGTSSYFSYDQNSNLVGFKDALGNSVTYKYDKLNRISSQIRNSGKETKYNYDSQDNIIGYTDYEGNTTLYNYDLNNQVKSVKAADGSITKYDYDCLGNMISEKDALNKETKYSYDSEGNLTDVIYPNDSSEQYTYDIAGRTESHIYPDGSAVSYDYNAVNQLTDKTYSDVSGETSAGHVQYVYDKFGNRSSMSDDIGDTEYEYDLMGRIISVTDANNKSVKYEYDDANRISKIVYPDNHDVEYKYDKNDNLIKVITDSGSTVYNYDAADRVVKAVRPDGTSTTYGYDKDSNVNILKTETSEGGLLSEFRYEYDGRGYVTKETSKKYSSSGMVSASRVYTYNSTGELETFTEISDGDKTTYNYLYDAAGNRIKLSIEDENSSEVISYEYNEQNQLISEKSSVYGETKYTYDANGNIINEDSNDFHRSYEYTVEKRLSIVREGGELLMAATYDGDGNRVFTASRTENEYIEKNNTKRNNNYAVAKDEDKKKGKLVSLNKKQKKNEASTKEMDADGTSGDVSSVNSISFFWFGFGTELSLLSCGTNSTEGFLLSNWWRDIWDNADNIINILTNKKKNYDNKEYLKKSGLSDEEISDVLIPEKIEDDLVIGYDITYYVNDINRDYAEVLQKYDENGTLINDYTYGLERIYDYNVKQKDSEYYIYDGRGSVAQVYSSDDLVTGSYEYDPYGNILSGMPQNKDFYGYNAEDTSSVTGLEYLRARYYNPSIGRFGAQDIIYTEVGVPLQNNRYIYARNNPNYYKDPTGENAAFVVAVGTLVGAVAGGVSSGIKAYRDNKKYKNNPSKKVSVGAAIFQGAMTGTVAGAVGTATYLKTGSMTLSGAAAGAAAGAYSVYYRGGTLKEAGAEALKGAVSGGLMGGLAKLTIGFGGGLLALGLVSTAGSVGLGMAGRGKNAYDQQRKNNKSVSSSLKYSFKSAFNVYDIITDVTSSAAGFAVGTGTNAVLMNSVYKGCITEDTVSVQEEVQNPKPSVADEASTKISADDVIAQNGPNPADSTKNTPQSGIQNSEPISNANGMAKSSTSGMKKADTTNSSSSGLKQAAVANEPTASPKKSIASNSSTSTPKESLTSGSNKTPVGEGGSGKQSGSYVIKYKSGKVYVGKGPKSRMEQSAKYRADENNDIVVSKEWEPANSNEDAFIDEYLKLKEYGGPKSSNTYNKIQSPGKKYYENRIDSQGGND